jgi:hypothetical protein
MVIVFHLDSASCQKEKIWLGGDPLQRTHSCRLPKNARKSGELVSKLPSGQRTHPNAPSLVCIDETWHDGPHVCAGADKQEDDQKEGLEVEEGRLGDFQDIIRTHRSGQAADVPCWNVAGMWPGRSSAGISDQVCAALPKCRRFGIRRFGGNLATIYSPSISESPLPSSLPRQPKCPPPPRCHLILLPQNSKTGAYVVSIYLWCRSLNLHNFILINDIAAINRH